MLEVIDIVVVREPLVVGDDERVRRVNFELAVELLLRDCELDEVTLNEMDQVLELLPSLLRDGVAVIDEDNVDERDIVNVAVCDRLPLHDPSPE